MIEELRSKFRQNLFELTKHAVDRTILRNITLDEIREAVANGIVIEDYPNDKYGPSCLILGFTLTRRALHIQCSYPSRPLVKVITVYEPNPSEWIDRKVRRS